MVRECRENPFAFFSLPLILLCASFYAIPLLSEYLEQAYLYSVFSKINALYNLTQGEIGCQLVKAPMAAAISPTQP